MKTLFTILFISILGIFSFVSLSADDRSYVWTYEYMTMERGEAEMEQYTTFKTVNTDDFETTTSAELNLELEFGMNDRFDFAVYQSFKQGPDGNFSYAGFKLRGRYKLGEKGKWFVDPLIYLEYKSNPTFSKHVIEPKLILAKDFGKFNIALNPYFEYEYEDSEWEFKPKYAAGFHYKLSRLMKIGAEFKGDEHNHYFGPTISHGNGGMFVALGALFGTSVETGSADYLMRMIIGVHL